ncbi:hypothetical protein [Vreelandella populi]|uniref:hypothetical protein n=1 Tax=Vreelandella populi TaxID=2498858 RepID=UPI000F8E8EBE|nr:hypothetical protein [Halomonas populi]RUR38524.1 hypothetical protein ELY25_09175 [Halomonas populi]
MIMISSKAGQRLAKAKAARDSYINKPEVEGEDAIAKAIAKELFEAAYALADELIADRHHLVEGD